MGLINILMLYRCTIKTARGKIIYCRRKMMQKCLWHNTRSHPVVTASMNYIFMMRTAAGYVNSHRINRITKTSIYSSRSGISRVIGNYCSGHFHVRSIVPGCKIKFFQRGRNAGYDYIPLHQCAGWGGLQRYETHFPNYSVGCGSRFHLRAQRSTASSIRVL